MRRLVFALGVLVAVLGLVTTTAPVSAQTNEAGWIAYVQNGDIWTRTLPDGTPQQLTTDGKNLAPHISSSGEWISFLKDDTAWVMTRTGEQARSVANCRLDWSPTADALACAGQDGVVRIVRAPEFKEEVLVALPEGVSQSYISGLAWSPDGATLAYTRDDQLSQGSPPDRRSSLETVNVAIGTVTEHFNLGTPSQDGLIAAGWSPNGNAALYWTDPAFSASMQADGLALSRFLLADNKTALLNEGALTYSDFLRPSPVKNELALAAGNYRGSWTNKQIVVVDTDTAASKTLTDKSVAAISPAWSSDGAHIAYVSMPDRGDLVGGTDARVGLRQRRIWVLNADGSQPHALTNDANYRDEYPLWSNDGATILFARMYQPSIEDASQDVSEIWMMRADGSDPVKVADLPGANDNAPYGSSSDDAWFGYYGHINWDNYFDWWQPNTRVMPAAGTPVPDFLRFAAVGMCLLIAGLMLLTYKPKFSR